MSEGHFKEHVEAFEEAVRDGMRARSLALAKELAPLLAGKDPEEAEAIFKAKLTEAMDAWERDALARLERLPKVDPDDIIRPGDEWKLGRGKS